MGQNLTIMETDRLSEGLSSINMDMVQDTKGVYWPGFVALGAGTFAIFNFLTRWLLPGGKTHFLDCLCRKYISFRTKYAVCSTTGKSSTALLM